MNDRSQEEEALSQAQILANVERQINVATAAISEACKQLQQEADKLHNERETFDRMSKKIESTQISETVNLNIGGQHFTTDYHNSPNADQGPKLVLCCYVFGKVFIKAF